jgi:hypothetical protein
MINTVCWIASMKGKRMPLEDLRYLTERDSKHCQLAMSMRKPEKDGKDEKSVLDEKDRQGYPVERAGTTDSVESAAFCGSSGEGGETSAAGGSDL